MKKILLLFVLFAVTVFGQEIVSNSAGQKIILNKDFSWKLLDDNSVGLKAEYFKPLKDNISAGIFEKVQIPMKDGEDKTVNIYFEFMSTKSQFENTSLENIQRIIDYSRDYTMLRLKNKYSFIPRKIKISFSEKNNAWFVMWEYTAKNSYGGETAGDQIVLYDNDGKRVEI